MTDAPPGGALAVFHKCLGSHSLIGDAMVARSRTSGSLSLAM